MAYNGMKQRCLMLNGVGLGDAEMKKISLIKRITNKGHNLQVMAVNSLKEFLVFKRDIDAKKHQEFERQMKEKDRILRRIMDSNKRFLGMGFRQSLMFTKSEVEKERLLLFKQRGVMRRMLDANTRLMSMGMNKLREVCNARKADLKTKMKGIIATLRNQDLGLCLGAYNS